MVRSDAEDQKFLGSVGCLARVMLFVTVKFISQEWPVF